MKHRKNIILIVFLLSFSNAYSQKWGLYTLYSVKGSNTALLVDTNGATYKTWTFAPNKKTCFSSYLIPGDTLVRTVSYPGNIITGGPISGEVQKVDWNGNVVWDFIYSTATTVLHHDICPMPNGNVLMIAEEIKSAADATQAGSSATGVRNAEKIIEVMPTGPTSGTIVWEWNIWDHLCQNVNSAKDNYVTSISDNPQLLNLNYNGIADFMHMNGIAYNPVLNQIAFSSFAYSEIYVIDHSTTTAEAKSHSGGNSGHGGDIIYRWGNPNAYGVAGTSNFKEAHNAHWVSSDNPKYPNYLCGFNNKGGTGGNSSVDIIAPPYNGYNYLKTTGQAYAPASYAWRYNASCVSQNEGTSQQLPNGNTLVCLTFCNSIIEVDSNGTTLWSIKPANTTSNALRYSKCYVRGPRVSASASSTKITSGTLVTLHSVATSVTETNPKYTFSWSSEPSGFTSSEQNPTVSPKVTTRYLVTITNTDLGCSDTSSVFVNVETTGVNEQVSPQNDLVIYPNPTSGMLHLSGDFLNSHAFELNCRNMYGETIMNSSNATELDFSSFPNGVYYLTVKTNYGEISNCKVVKIQ